MRRRKLFTIIGLVLAGVWGVCLGLLHLHGDIWFLDRVEGTMVDVRTTMRGAMQAPDNVALVAIDDETVSLEGRYPISRLTLARLVDEIARHGAAAIAIDVLLVDAGNEQGDKALARSLQSAPATIAAGAVFASGVQWMAPSGADPLSRIPDATQFLLPLPIFANVAAIGVVNVAADPTGTPRFIPLIFKAGDRQEASLALRVSAMVGGVDPLFLDEGVQIGDRRVPTDLGYLMPLNFYGPRGTIPTISAATVLAGLDPVAGLRGRIVVVGSTVTGGGDVFPTPFDPVLPGAEVMATAIANMTTGGLLRDHRVRLVDAALSFVLPLVFIALIGWRRSGVSLAAICAVVAALVTLNFIAFSNGIWLSAALPLVAAAPPAILYGAAQLWLDRSRAQHFATQSELLKRVQASGLSDWLAKHGDFLEAPVEVDTSVVFIDLSGFTGLSETEGPTATREILNSFYALIDDEVTHHGGIVTSFMGDGAMILFGLPEPTPDDARNATRCCVGLAVRTRVWLNSLPPSIADMIGFKIGAHHGTIVASRLGVAGRQHIAVTGDTANVASRLMGIAAMHAADLALSQEILLAAGKRSEPYLSGNLQGPIETDIRGRANSVLVWLWTERAA